jgi:hypothetical protein
MISAVTARKEGKRHSVLDIRPCKAICEAIIQPLRNHPSINYHSTVTILSLRPLHAYLVASEEIFISWRKHLRIITLRITVQSIVISKAVSLRDMLNL